MDIFVINLKRSADRRDRIVARLSALGLRGTLFAAVDAASGEHLRFPNYDEDACRRAWRRGLSPGEIGCMASHYSLWQHCRDSGRPIVILEDDAVPSQDFAEAIDVAAQALVRFHYVRFSAFKARPTRPIDMPGLRSGWQMVGFSKGPLGMAAYALTPAGASRLLARADRWLEPADIYADHFWLHGVSCVGLTPWTVVQDGLESTIDMRGPRWPGPGWQIRRLARKAVDNGLRIAWNATQAPWREPASDPEAPVATQTQSS